LINRRLDLPAAQDRPATHNASLDLEFSVIEPNERNKISFLKEPSFLNRRSEQEDLLRCSQVDCGPLLTSRNFLSNQETSKNIELLERRILLSDGNEESEERRERGDRESGEKGERQSMVASFLPEDPHEQTFTPVAGLKQLETTPALTEASRRGRVMVSPRSRGSSHTSKSSTQAFNYKTIFLLLGILLGLNLILKAFA
jgi:hypothetical protein